MKIGIIGAGQLAQMMIAPSVALGLDIKILSGDKGDPASILNNTFIGDYKNKQNVLDFASDRDIITFEHEHIPINILEALENSGKILRPGIKAYSTCQNKILMRKTINKLNIAQPQFFVIENKNDLSDILSGDKLWVIKQPKGGYDGKGVFFAKDISELPHDLTCGLSDENPLLLEQFIDFDFEMSQVLSRDINGNIQYFPLAKTYQKNGICSQVTVDASGVLEAIEKNAQSIALSIAEDLNVIGILAVEMFAKNNKLYINELAVRPHNTAHFTQDACISCQFEQHIRAVAGLPLGSPKMLRRYAYMANILGGPETLDKYYATLQKIKDTDIKVHFYNKQYRPFRKAGHINIAGDDLSDIAERAENAAKLLNAQNLI